MRSSFSAFSGLPYSATPIVLAGIKKHLHDAIFDLHLIYLGLGRKLRQEQIKIPGPSGSIVSTLCSINNIDRVAKTLS